MNDISLFFLSVVYFIVHVRNGARTDFFVERINGWRTVHICVFVIDDFRLTGAPMMQSDAILPLWSTVCCGRELTRPPLACLASAKVKQQQKNHLKFIMKRGIEVTRHTTVGRSIIVFTSSQEKCI